MSPQARHPNPERYRRLDTALRDGDLATLQDELGDLDGFPNVVADPAIGACLTYAIYHAPIALIGSLLDVGANPDWPDDDGFPPLIAALSCSEAPTGAAREPTFTRSFGYFSHTAPPSTYEGSTTTHLCITPQRRATSKL